MQDCKDAELRVRFNIVLLYAEGKGTTEIAAMLGCGTSTAIRAAKRFLAEGEAGLFDRRSENGDRKVDDDMLATLKEFDGCIILHFLPPYSPEHNPIERLWKEVHANVTRNHRCKTIDELLANVHRFLERAQSYPGAKAYFDSRSL